MSQTSDFENAFVNSCIGKHSRHQGYLPMFIRGEITPCKRTYTWYTQSHREMKLNICFKTGKCPLVNVGKIHCCTILMKKLSITGNISAWHVFLIVSEFWIFSCSFVLTTLQHLGIISSNGSRGRNAMIRYLGWSCVKGRRMGCQTWDNLH